jgi:SepF-like predicted cell division protein (DUF552 family)
VLDDYGDTKDETAVVQYITNGDFIMADTSHLEECGEVFEATITKSVKAGAKANERMIAAYKNEFAEIK